MKFKEWEIKPSKNPESFVEVYKNSVLQAQIIDTEEARRYIWMQLKGTEDEVGYLSEDMFTE